MSWFELMSMKKYKNGELWIERGNRPGQKNGGKPLRGPVSIQTARHLKYNKKL